MTQFGATSAAPRNTGITNGPEIGAYVVAQVIKVALTYAVHLSGVLSPVYLWAFHTGGAIAIVPVTFVISAFWAVVTLILFIVLRGSFGGVPAMVAGPGKERAVTTSGGEIGAYAIAYLIVIAVLMALNGMVLGMVYVSLNRSGQAGLAVALGQVTSIAGAAVAYGIFIGLRTAFCRR